MGMNQRLLRPSASGFNPRSITGLALWLDASDAATLFQDAAATTRATATSDPVGAWLDKSGNARHAVQSTTTAGYRPSFQPASSNFNGKNTLLFGAGSGSLLTPATIANLFKNPTTAPEMTVICAGYSPIAVQGGSWQIGSDVQANGRLFFAIGYGSEGSMLFDTIDAGGGRLTNSFGTAMAYRPHTLAFYRHTSAMGVRLDGGVMAAKANASGNYSATSARLQIGKADGLSYGAIYLSEMLVYAGALSASDIENVESYLSKKWSMSNAYVGGPKVSNVDAQDWIRRVYVSGGTVSSSTATAVNDFCNAIDAANIRDKFYRLNLFCGGTSGASDGLAACLVPLYRGPSRLGVQYGNAIDINTGPFVVGDYAETGASGGLYPGASNASKYLVTGLTPAGIPEIATGHLSAYIMSGFSGAIGGVITALGTSFANNYSIELNRGASGFIYGAWGEGGSFTPLVSPAQGAGYGHTIVSRTSGTSLSAYKNGSLLNTSTTAVTPTTHTANWFLFANNLNGSPANYLSGRLGGYSIGASMNGTQAAAFSTAMAAFQTALGRNV